MDDNDKKNNKDSKTQEIEETRPVSNGMEPEDTKKDELVDLPLEGAEDIIPDAVLEVPEEVLAESDIVADAVIIPDPIAPGMPAKTFQKNFQKGNRRGGGGRRGGGRRAERVRPEFDQKIVSMRRVTRVVAGGRRMSFSVAVVVGNRKGKVGVGTGKAVDTSLAIDKAVRSAKKNIITVLMTKTNSIPHDVKAKYAASVIALSPSKGRGLVAGGSVRNVLELSGVTDISGKLLSRSKNGLNNARATIKALEMLKERKTR